MALYYAGQKNRLVKRQSGLASQFERIRQKKKAAAESEALGAARGGLLKILSSRVERGGLLNILKSRVENAPALSQGEETKTPEPGTTPASVSNPSGPKEVTTNAGNNRSRGRDGQSGRK